jgi:hypothetical protein
MISDWIQERGLYYPRNGTRNFALLESRDFNEPPLKGGLLVADFENTSMVWHRSCALSAGAYRMLANMISYGTAK